MIQARPAFKLTLTVPQIDELGTTPYGLRKIPTVTVGGFVGSGCAAR